MNGQRPNRECDILCVDDDTYLTDLLRYALSRVGYSVQLAHSGAAALRAAQVKRPDLVIADVNLPDIDGFQLCAQLRRQFDLPVIMLTARTVDDDILTGFDHGAQDYIAKPFSMHVLICRVEAVLRRTNPASTEHSTKRLRRLHSGWFDTEQQRISANGVTAKLTATESKILELLLTNQGQVLSAERIIEELWDDDSDTYASVVKTHIRYLRSKLAPVFGSVAIIETVRGLGYTFQNRHADTALEEVAG
jgi:DNA-binding response OmpR family regulator